MNNWKDIMKFTIVRESLPSRQLENKIITEINLGRLYAGAKLPCSRELANFYSLNRNTVRKTYDRLNAAGWLYSVPRKGTFVCKTNPFLINPVPQIKASNNFSETGIFLSEETKPENISQPILGPDLEASAYPTDDILFSRFVKAYKNCYYAGKWKKKSSGFNNIKETLSLYIKQHRQLFHFKEELHIVTGTELPLSRLAKILFHNNDCVIRKHLDYYFAFNKPACGIFVIFNR